MGEEDRMAYDPTVNIDLKHFYAILDGIRNELYEEGKKTLAASLSDEGVKLDHNKWTQTVPAEHMKRILDIEKDIVSKIRELIKVPNLMLEVVVNKLVKPEDERPFTVQEKLDFMLRKNPELNEFIRRFDAMLDYR
jgi:hypothetical protein